MIVYREIKNSLFKCALVQKCCDFTGGFVPFSVNQSLNGQLLIKIFVFVVWCTIVYRCSLILTLKLNNHTFELK